MKKILIISYFYPESAFVGGQRTAYWAKNLHEHGYYPIVVTRNWNHGQATLTEPVEDNVFHVEKKEGYEVHQLPFERSLRDKMDGKSSMRYFQKMLTLWELIASNFSKKALPYANFLPYCENLIQSKSIDLVLISGRPFQQFHFGYYLKNKFGTPWIADYRDEWNSHYRIPPTGILRKFIASLERKSELRWISNADHLITVSEAGLERLQNFTGKSGSVVRNGFEPTEKISKKDENKLKLLYAGTLYPYQDLTMIVESILNINDQAIEFHLIGGFDTPQVEADYRKLMQQHPETFLYTNKLPKEDFQELAHQMDIGVLTPYQNLDGCLPVKIFDYYALGLELLLCPSDHDLMATFISETQSGIALASVKDCESYLKEHLQKKRSNQPSTRRDFQLGNKYSRSFQTNILAETLDQVLSN
ncbi:MAG: glycosyltransferase [Crocinitomicaceae bacterium]